MAKDLRQKLIENRTRQGRGTGKAYWDSVMEVIGLHYGGEDLTLIDRKEFHPPLRILAEEVVEISWTLDCRTPEDAFKEDLEHELDELFPKGHCKERGAALVLFSFANIFFRKHLKRAIKKL